MHAHNVRTAGQNQEIDSRVIWITRTRESVDLRREVFGTQVGVQFRINNLEATVEKLQWYGHLILRTIILMCVP